MISAIMYDLLHFGFWQFDNKGFNPLVALELQLSDDVNEGDLINIKKWPGSNSRSEYKQRHPEFESPSCASLVRLSLFRG